MFSKVNIQGIIILAVVLLIIQFSVGIFISPVVKKIAVDAINKSGSAKIQLDSFRLWPVTLKVSIRGFKIFDPDGEERMVKVDSAGCRLSFFGLLSKRIIFSKVDLSGVDISVEGEPDGSFNIEKLAEPEKKEKGRWGLLDRFKDKDWFSRIYRIIKERHSRENIEEEKKERKKRKKIKKEVVKLPKGRRVKFKTISDDYVLVVKTLVIKNGEIDIAENNTKLLDINKVVIKLTDFAFDPEQGMDLGSLALRGRLEKNEKDAGNISLRYRKYYSKNNVIADIDFQAGEIDLSAVSFVYDGSLPIGVDKGILNVNSSTELVNENINSRNEVVLRDHELTPKRGGPKTLLGFIPVQTLCKALNQTTPLKLEFDATGPVSSPKITGFEKTLKNIVQPFMENVLKDEGVSVVKGFLRDKLGIKETPATAGGETAASGEESAEQTVDAIKSLFKKD
jgi:hypothetical protein